MSKDPKAIWEQLKRRQGDIRHARGDPGGLRRGDHDGRRAVVHLHGAGAGRDGRLRAGRGREAGLRPRKGRCIRCGQVRIDREYA